MHEHKRNEEHMEKRGEYRRAAREEESMEKRRMDASI